MRIVAGLGRLVPRRRCAAAVGNGQAPQGADPTPDQVKAVYQEICLSYRAIDDFRAKLLSLLPAVSGVGVGVLLGKDPGEPEPLWLPIGLFGTVVTLGLFAYELYGVQKCGGLIAAGRRIEQNWNCVGQFDGRPHALAGLVNEPFAAALVYPAVLAGWMYLVLADWSERGAAIIVVGLFGGLFVSGSSLCVRMHLRDTREREAEAARRHVARPEPGTAP
ncbi:hypothetical protein OG453_37740 [Streptomyces sp. NBC_01381]|uniref:hypothetical protein n=1 Tax=Streptomyces sp. NBC_01381 TaxID=2903845 RepID=UPI00225339AF|nr:hypothetical protein [Streptomyces sp. NBC_01381]MCX4672344.1 hypothetical protein [Streptomyces sp. NBC_01381]